MKNKLGTLFIALTLMVSGAKAQDLPQPSPKATFTQVVGITDVSMEYSRPAVKGRTIFGDLVAFNEFWRTGANSPTKIEFSTAVKFAGKDVPAGSYSIFSIPTDGAFKVILSKETSLPEGGKYDNSKVAAEFEAKMIKTLKPVESLEFSIRNITKESADLVMEWADRGFVVPLEINTNQLAEEAIAMKLKEINGQFGFYNDAARFYLETGKNKEALEYAKKSVELYPAFFNMLTLSKAEAANGNFKEAISVAQKSSELAKKAGNKFYVSQNQQNIESWKKN